MSPSVSIGREIGNVFFHVYTRDEFSDIFFRKIKSREKTYVAFGNANLVTYALKDPYYCEIIKRFLTVNDGIGVEISSLLLHRKRFPANLNGTDLIPFLLENTPVPLRVFLFGGKPDVVAEAAAKISALGQSEVCGYRDGYKCWGDMAKVISDINQARPDLVLVALGNPLQERWIAEHGAAINTSVLMGVGALFDYMSGRKRRAPKLFLKLRAEWVYRLLTEPRRLGRRYTIGLVEFFWLLLSNEMKRRYFPSIQKKTRSQVENMK